MAETDPLPYLVAIFALITSGVFHRWFYRRYGAAVFQSFVAKLSVGAWFLLAIALLLLALGRIGIDELYQCTLAALLSAAASYQTIKRRFPFR
jgi:hypothetical protein